MPTYDYMCSTCESVSERVHGMNEAPEYLCSACGTKLRKTFLTAPACNLGWDNQAAGNAGKYWGTKPIKSISCPPEGNKPGFHIQGTDD